MSKKYGFKAAFEDKFNSNLSSDELSLQEGKFGSFLRKHIGPLLIGGASFLTPDLQAATPKPKPAHEIRADRKAEDVITIAKTLYAEARGEGTMGMRYVATIIYNRANGDKTKYASECKKKYQFSCWTGKDDITVVPESKSYKQALKIAWEMMTGKFQPETFTEVTNPKFYCNDKLFNSDLIYDDPKLSYIANVKNSGKYEKRGNHYFYNLVKPSVVKKPVVKPPEIKAPIKPKYVLANKSTKNVAAKLPPKVPNTFTKLPLPTKNVKRNR